MPLVPLTKTLEPLGKEFYAIEVVELAKALLGKILVR
jgi:3-methyladenine DNA glycosylase Mpg